MSTAIVPAPYPRLRSPLVAALLIGAFAIGSAAGMAVIGTRSVGIAAGPAAIAAVNQPVSVAQTNTLGQSLGGYMSFLEGRAQLAAAGRTSNPDQSFGDYMHFLASRAGLAQSPNVNPSTGFTLPR